MTMTTTDLDVLVRDLASANGVARSRAREALVAIGRAAVPRLMSAFREGGKTRQWEAAKSLVDIGDPQAAGVFVAALENPDDGVRWIGAEGIAALGRAGLPELLRALRNEEKGGEMSPWLRTGARRALKFAAKEDPRLADLVAPLITALDAKDSVAQIPIAAAQLQAAL